MSDSERCELFQEIESVYLNFKNNEDDFIKSWENFKNNPKTRVIANNEVAQFYADCERFTKLIIKTHQDNEELDKKWDELVSKNKKLEKRGKKK